MVSFRGTADRTAGPPRRFRDEDGLEWAGPHNAGDPCPWGFCATMDFRPLAEPDAVGAPGTDRPWCHTVDGDTSEWSDFVEDKVFISEIE